MADDKRRLNKTFNQRARKALVACFAAAALLTGCAASPVRDTTPPHTHEAAAGSHRFGPDTETLFRRNAAQPVNEDLPSDEKIRQYMKQICFAPDDKTVDEKNMIRRALEDLSALPVMGKPLVGLAAREKVQFCNMKMLQAGVGAQYMPGLAAVVSSDAATPGDMMLRIAHEIVHAAQDTHGLLAYQYAWDIESRVQRSLSIEAAALTAEFLIAFELKQHNKPELWDYLRTRYVGGSYADPATYTLIETTYQAAKTDGQTDAQALQTAGVAAWKHMFNNAGWRTFYLNLELARYLSDISSGALDDQSSIQARAIDQKRVSAAGRLSKDVSFTEGAQMPSLVSILSHDTKMRQAYAAVDLERHRRSLGESHAQTRALHDAARADGNPYLGVNLAKVLQDMSAESFPDQDVKRRFSYLYQYLDDAAGLSSASVTTPTAPDTRSAPVPPVIPAATPVTPLPVVPAVHDEPIPVPPRDTLARLPHRHLPPAA